MSDVKSDSGVIAYFCAEFGFTNEFQIYSGGLGILAGDHLKEASDLNYPLIAVGLLYRDGYFTQKISGKGEQIAEFNKINIPRWVKKVEIDGKPLRVEVSVNDENIVAEVYECKVGHKENVTLYLLDSHVPENSERIKSLTSKLYCSDRRERFEQEILLGVGGWKALKLLGINVECLHLNEGHSVFSAIQWVSETMEDQDVSFEDAIELVKKKVLFTTHTPVPAGNEEFDMNLARELLPSVAMQMGIDLEDLLNLGKGPTSDNFGLSVVALRVSGFANGVSKIHGSVSRDMWKDLWPNKKVEEVPIGHVTNGVHYGSWVAPKLDKLYQSSFGKNIQDDVDDKSKWVADELSSENVWKTHLELKKEMLKDVTGRIKNWANREGVDLGDNGLPSTDEGVLTIGFARRFAPYKRATLIFNDEEKLYEILNNADKPVQIIFAGKAHPADVPGQALIKKVVEISQTPKFRGKIFFVEGYNIEFATKLVQGCDVWLNLPTPPLEASGTSGEKAAINGVLNLSVLDGWWDEGFNGKDGWGIKEKVGESEKDAASRVYDVMREVANIYYDKNENGMSLSWVNMMKNSICTCNPEYTTMRMLKDYWTKYYSQILRG